MKVFANMADFVTVRDQYFKGFAPSTRRHPPKNSGDPRISFLLISQKKDTACIDSLKLENKDKFVVFTVRPWFEKVKQFEQIAQILDALIEERGVTPCFRAYGRAS